MTSEPNPFESPAAVDDTPELIQAEALRTDKRFSIWRVVVGAPAGLAVANLANIGIDTHLMANNVPPPYPSVSLYAGAVAGAVVFLLLEGKRYFLANTSD